VRRSKLAIRPDETRNTRKNTGKTRIDEIDVKIDGFKHETGGLVFRLAVRATA
jgi:hypothetical protein